MRKPGPPLVSLPARHQNPADRRPGAKEVDYRRLAEIAAQDDAERQRGIKLLRVLSGNPRQPYIALTFDDGPHGGKTVRLLDLLKKLHCPSTFFLVGAQARRYPELVQRIVVEGHELGNHTFNHYRLTRIPSRRSGRGAEPHARATSRDRGIAESTVSPARRRVQSGNSQNCREKRLHHDSLDRRSRRTTNEGGTPQELERLVIRDITPGGIILCTTVSKRRFNACRIWYKI